MKNKIKKGKGNKHLLIASEVLILVFSFIYVKSNNIKIINSEPEFVIQQKNTLSYTDLAYELRKTEVVSPKLTPTATPVPKKTSSYNVELEEEKTLSDLKSDAISPIPAQNNATELIKKYSKEYGVNEDMMLVIANCESGYRSNAINGPYAGVYQFLATTWASNRRAMGLDPDPNLRFQPEEAIKTAAFKMSRDGFGAWPACSRKAYNLISEVK